jgi:hypothetical protein
MDQPLVQVEIIRIGKTFTTTIKVMLRSLFVVAIFVSAILGQLALQAEDAPIHRTNSSALSAPTNSLQAGIVMDTPEGVIHVKDGKVLTSIYFVLVNSSSNQVYYYAPKKTKERFKLEMIDPTGNSIALTRLGKQFGAKPSVPLGTPSLNWNHFPISRTYVSPNDEIAFSFESPQDKEYNFDWKTTFLECFEPLPPGNFKLQITQRLYFRDDKGLLQAVIIPITVPVKVESSSNSPSR